VEGTAGSLNKRRLGKTCCGQGLGEHSRMGWDLEIKIY